MAVLTSRTTAAVLALGLFLAPPLPTAGARTSGRHAGMGQADSTRALRLLSRATFGARPTELAELLALGPDRWLEGQLHPERIDDSALDARLAAFPAAAMSVAELYAAFPPAAAARRRAAAGASPGAAPRRGGMRGPARIAFDLIGARLQRAVYSRRQLEEVMTEFWFNHFNVFFGKAADRYLIGSYEREAIRPYVFGRFEDMLRATAEHPAMLVYLDNWRSVVPDTTDPSVARPLERLRRFAALSPGQQDALARSGRITEAQLQRLRRAAANLAASQPGINENYARELMELHTLGVDGGYTQQDVIEVARAFSGWTLDRGGPGARRAAGGGSMRPAAAEPRFVFRPRMHDHGEKVVLGHALAAGRGMQDGLDVLHVLATSPATAHHIARELAERFVSDAPPPALVDRLARVFLDTHGDLRALTRALFTAPELYASGAADRKVKTPFELVASALRATDAEVGPSRMLVQTLRTLGEAPYLASFPTGYPARSDDWVNSGALLTRMNLGLALAAGRVDGVRIDVPALAGDAGGGGVATDAAVHVLASRLLPGTPTAQLERAVDADLAEHAALPTRARLARAAGLVLGSPDFQRR